MQLLAGITYGILLPCLKPRSEKLWKYITPFVLVIITSAFAALLMVTRIFGNVQFTVVEGVCTCVWYVLLFLDSRPALQLRKGQGVASFFVHVGFILWFATFLTRLSGPAKNFARGVRERISGSVS